MFGKVNVFGMVKHHLAILRDWWTGRYRLSDFVVFFGIPLLVGYVVVFLSGSCRVFSGSGQWLIILLGLFLVGFSMIVKKRADVLMRMEIDE